MRFDLIATGETVPTATGCFYIPEMGRPVLNLECIFDTQGVGQSIGGQGFYSSSPFIESVATLRDLLATADDTGTTLGLGQELRMISNRLMLPIDELILNIDVHGVQRSLRIVSGGGKPGIVNDLYIDMSTGRINPTNLLNIGTLEDLVAAVTGFLNKPGIAYDPALGDGLYIKRLPTQWRLGIMLRTHPDLAVGVQTGLCTWLSFFRQEIWLHNVFVAADPMNPLPTEWFRGSFKLGPAIEQVEKATRTLLTGHEVAGKALIKPIEHLPSQIYGAVDNTAGFIIHFTTNGEEYTVRLSVTINDDGTYTYRIGEFSTVLSIAAPMSKAFWGYGFFRLIGHYDFLKIDGKYFHEWLGADRDGVMKECDSDGNLLSPIKYLLEGAQGEVAYIIRRRATLENFLRFLRGDAAPSEAQWAKDPTYAGMGMATLLAEYRSP
nr:hypothetical protein [Candidatus Sigynarchaeum springense]